MNNLSIRYKLLLGFLFMACLLVMSSIYSFYNLNYIKNYFINIVDRNIPRLEAILEMQNTSTQVSSFIHNFNNQNKSLSPIQVDNDKNELLAYLGNIDQLQKKYQSHLTDGEEGSLNIQALHKSRDAVIIAALDTFSALTLRSNINLINEKKNALSQAQAHLEESILDAVAVESSRLDKAKKSALEITQQMYYFSFLTDGIIIIIALLISFIFVRSISRPIIHLTNFANQISLDNLDQRIIIKSKDEIGQLSISINSMLAHLAETRSELIALSREAGISEVATSILHNIGNVVNSINVSAFSMKQLVAENNGEDLQKITSLLHEHIDHLENFLKEQRGRYVVPYLDKLSRKFKIYHDKVTKELDELILHLQHVITVINMQQNLNKSSGITESIVISQLIDELLSLHHKKLMQSKIVVEKDYTDLPSITCVKAKLQQILINLIKNAIESFPENDMSDKKISIHARQAEGKVYLSITDNGIGVEKNNLVKIFMFGFTTKPNGHGYGLHHSANLAKELNGKLSVSSKGAHQGATFTLEIPTMD